MLVPTNLYRLSKIKIPGIWAYKNVFITFIYGNFHFDFVEGLTIFAGL